MTPRCSKNQEQFSIFEENNRVCQDLRAGLMSLLDFSTFSKIRPTQHNPLLDDGEGEVTDLNLLHRIR
jgi:hypothetical protein